jgi:hypothetical protein
MSSRRSLNNNPDLIAVSLPTDISLTQGPDTCPMNILKPFNHREATSDKISRDNQIGLTLLLLKKEQELLESNSKCLVCRRKPREATFLPCGHFDTCRDCAATAVWCPHCDSRILATVDTFLS